VLADDEVEYEEIRGHFWYLRYPLVEPVALPNATMLTHVTVATTRPETMLGDTAVAMNPADPRAKALMGRKVRLPIVGRIIPIIADDHVVLPDPGSDDPKARFSTGFLKVTPAHDPDDYQIGQRHGLPLVNVMAPDGTISDRHGWTDWDQIRNGDVENLIGMDRFEAREAVVEWFRRQGLLEEVRDYTHQVGHSYRSHVPIEPYLSDQWYIAVKKQIPQAGKAEIRDPKSETATIPGTDVPANSLAGLALSPVLDGRLRFVPERYATTYRTWLENLRDWPISRQLWWGHRIPVWSQDLELPNGIDHSRPTDRGPDAATCAALDSAVGGHFGETLRKFRDVHYYLLTTDHPDREGWVRTHICLDKDDPGAIALIEQAGWIRDGDVLDTWFSSALWPFSTLGWPAPTDELKTFYPGDVLVTAREIITLWVSRMVMMGRYCLGDVPFHDVFIHAMIQDGEGRKMSKSLGNGIDPLDIIDSHGADAMRFTLCSMTTQTQDVRMPIEEMTLPDGRKCNTSPKFDIGRNFCNKLWNASRFVLMKLEGAPAWTDIQPRGHLADAWILSRLNATIRDATAALEAYRFNELADTLYHFLWDDFCDWYVEIAKARIIAGQTVPKAILAHCLDGALRMLHPVAPFITEAIWRRLNDIAPTRGPGDTEAEPMLVRAQWPQADGASIDGDAEQRFSLLSNLIRSVRNVRMQHNVAPAMKLDLLIETDDPAAKVLEDGAELMKSLAQAGQVTISRTPVSPPADAAAVPAAGVKLYVLGIIDRSAELERLTKQRDTLGRGIRAIESKLGNEQFLARAPADLVQKERQRLESLKTDLAAVEKSLAALAAR
jgi:valyl-tRNA synthetase